MSTKALAPVAARVGEPKHWVRDFSLIGGVTGFAAPLAVAPAIAGAGYVAAAAVAGVASGAALGLLAPKLLGKLGSVRLPVLVFGGLGVGAVWGGAVGAAAALFSNADLFWLSVMLAGIAGAVQFGWVWLPYVLKKIQGKKTWPLVLGALVAAPALGWASIWLFAMLAGVLEVIF